MTLRRSLLGFSVCEFNVLLSVSMRLSSNCSFQYCRTPCSDKKIGPTVDNGLVAANLRSKREKRKTNNCMASWRTEFRLR